MVIYNLNDKIIMNSRPQNSIYFGVKFTEMDAVTLKDMSAFNMYCTITNASTLIPKINAFVEDTVKVTRKSRDLSGNPMLPEETGIYLSTADGAIFEILINLFPTTQFPVGTYLLDWILQTTRGASKVLFSMEIIFTDTLPDVVLPTQTPYVQVSINTIQPLLTLPIQTILVL